MSNLRVVQLIHPGQEHEKFENLDGNRVTPWNPTTRESRGRTVGNGHRRKFLLQNGTAVERSGADGWSRHSDLPLMFWGEWEAESRLVKELNHADGHPRFLVEPFWKKKRSYSGLHNTDPNVFDGPFKYVICLQNGSLTCLEKGSLILFGTRRGPKSQSRFVIDTVFVVRCWTDYSLETVKADLRSKSTEMYFNVSVGPMGGPDACAPAPSRKTERRLYYGATIDQTVEGMFSFFPCKSYRESDQVGFSRPVISLPAERTAPDGRPAPIVKDTFFNGKRYTLYNSPTEIATVWNSVVDQVLRQGLMLGVQATTPNRE